MLLDEIIALAADDKASIGVLLRKCVILAHHLRNDRLKAWANNELNGYRGISDIPSYRKIVAAARGNFTGLYGMTWSRWLIPPGVLEEKHRHWAEETILSQAIVAYENVLKSDNSDGNLIINWPGDLVLYYQQRIPNNKEMVLTSAWQEFAKSAVVELIDTVRNRVLNLALELQSEIGAQEADLGNLSPEKVKDVDRTVIQQIFGNVFVSSDQSSMQVQNTNVTLEDWKQLERVLEDSGLSKLEVGELSDAVKSDGSKMGAGVMDWIKRAAPKVVSSGVKVGASVGQTILTEYLKQHFGLH